MELNRTWNVLVSALITLLFLTGFETKGAEAQSNPGSEAPATAEPEDIGTNQQLKDVLFDFDSSDLTADARETLQRYAEILKTEPIDVLIEGHCDERGTEEYNQGLGERRATRVQEYLVELGVAARRLKTISYGDLRPACNGHDEECWQLNRRAHFVVSRE